MVKDKRKRSGFGKRYDTKNNKDDNNTSSDSEYEDIQPPAKRPRRNAAIVASDKIKKECARLNELKEAQQNESSDDDENESESETNNEIVIRFEGDEQENDKLKPRRYTIDEEPEDVQEFFKLITEPIKESTIDDQIDDFKALEPTKKQELINALKNRPTTENSIQLMYKILTMNTNESIKYMLLNKYHALLGLDTSTTEYYKHRNWLDKVCSIPFGIYKNIPVKLEDGGDKCNEFMKQANNYLEQAVYGQEEAKLQILQFISSKIVNPVSSGMALLLVGPPGIGKTSLIKNGIAKAINWPFQFISLGGDSDSSSYMGHQLVYESSHCGKIVNSLIAANSMSMILMFDELDKISMTPKGEEIQNMLVHLTDPVQNMDFEDKYVGAIPIDMSKVIYIFSANDINKIDRILLDRMNVIYLNGYNVDDKILIAEKYILPIILDSLNLKEQIVFSKEIIKYIIERYAASEKGVRELKRCMESICQKINMLRLYNSPSLPFYIKDFTLPMVLSRTHIDLFLKKKKPEDDRDVSLKMMYI
jgi:ATP-dependent Lon protease